MSDLLNTLRDALKQAVFGGGLLERPVGEYHAALSLLQDPDALLWRLLEERAGEVVEVLYDTYALDRERGWTTFKVGEAMAAIGPGNVPFRIPSKVSKDSILADYACLARAIAAQEERALMVAVQGLEVDS